MLYLMKRSTRYILLIAFMLVGRFAYAQKSSPNHEFEVIGMLSNLTNDTSVNNALRPKNLFLKIVLIS